jgi:hypothetical protein
MATSEKGSMPRVGDRVRVRVTESRLWAPSTLALLNGRRGAVDRVKEHAWPLEGGASVRVRFDEPARMGEHAAATFWFRSTEVEVLAPSSGA